MLSRAPALLLLLILAAGAGARRSQKEDGPSVVAGNATNKAREGKCMYTTLRACYVRYFCVALDEKKVKLFFR